MKQKGQSNLSEAERYKIEALLQAGVKVDDIAKQLKRHRSTIYNEINRGKTKQLNHDLTEKEIYLADVGQRLAKENQSQKGRPLKIGNDMEFVKHVEKMVLEEKYSPYAILEDIKNRNLKFNTEISLSTLKNYIRNGIFLNIKPKEKKKREEKRSVALKNLKGRSIEERPKEILARDKYGHWEMDTVVSGQGKGKACLLVLTERCTREELIFKMENKKAETTIKTLNKLERKLGAKKFRETFLSITMDNGVEFLDHDGIEKSVTNKKLARTITYYCHPYASSERGSNENSNRLIRKFVPKGSNIEELTEQDIINIQNWMNNYPRKLHNGKSANMIKKELAII